MKLAAGVSQAPRQYWPPGGAAVVPLPVSQCFVRIAESQRLQHLGFF
jgi:hypothetical protein